jgi:hypothetical protein
MKERKRGLCRAKDGLRILGTWQYDVLRGLNVIEQRLGEMQAVGRLTETTRGCQGTLATLASDSLAGRKE